jgi:hypothetical protein
MDTMLPRPKAFEPPKPTAKTHVHIGMYRPTFEEIRRIEQQCLLEGVMACPFGHTVRFRKAFAHRVMKCWREGCYDQPVYSSVKDILKPINDCLIEMLKKAETISQGGLPG